MSECLCVCLCACAHEVAAKLVRCQLGEPLSTLATTLDLGFVSRELTEML